MVDIDSIMAYEQGELGGEATLRLFGDLIASGAAWRLQGSYGRTAYDLIREGIIDPDGTVNERAVLALQDEADWR